MRLVKIAPIAVTVELSLPDCIQLYAALAHEADGMNSSDFPLCEALGNALLGFAFAARTLADDDPPQTIAKLWAAWAPYDSHAAPPRRITPPLWLPLFADGGAGAAITDDEEGGPA